MRGHNVRFYAKIWAINLKLSKANRTGKIIHVPITKLMLRTGGTNSADPDQIVPQGAI